MAQPDFHIYIYIHSNAVSHFNVDMFYGWVLYFFEIV